MKKTLLTLFLAAFNVALLAHTNLTTTVQLNLKSFSGINQTLPVLFIPLTNWLTDGTNVFAGKTILATPSNGVVTVNLAPNVYDVQIQGISGAKRIYVPLTNTPQNFLVLTTNLNSTYVYTPFYPNAILTSGGLVTNLTVTNLTVQTGPVSSGYIAQSADNNGTVVWVPNTSLIVLSMTNFSQRLAEWTISEAFSVSSVTLDTNNVIASGSVIWPNGATGTFTTTETDTYWHCVNAFTITHSGGYIVTQSHMSRSGDTGIVTNRPYPVITAY